MRTVRVGMLALVPAVQVTSVGPGSRRKAADRKALRAEANDPDREQTFSFIPSVCKTSSKPNRHYYYYYQAALQREGEPIIIFAPAVVSGKGWARQLKELRASSMLPTWVRRPSSVASPDAIGSSTGSGKTRT